MSAMLHPLMRGIGKSRRSFNAPVICAAVVRWC